MTDIIEHEHPCDLDVAIAHATDVADREGCTDCGTQHRQLAAWLTELRAVRQSREVLGGLLPATYDNPADYVRDLQAAAAEMVAAVDEVHRQGDGYVRPELRAAVTRLLT